MKQEILFLNHDDVKRSIGFNMLKVIEEMEKVFSLHESGDTILPNKTVLRWGDMESESIRGRINSMPAYIGGDYQACGIKWISSAPQNPFKYGLPRASGIIILNDPETLVPYAIMDGTFISAMRTGANSGVAAKYLAKKDAKTLGLIGAGVQNRTQLLALSQSLPGLETIKIADLDLERAKKFAEEMSEIVSLPIEVVGSAQETVTGADVFVTATVTTEPIVKADWVSPGSLYLHVGSHECEFEVIHQADKIVVDDWEELKHRGVETISIMYAQGLFDERNIYAELGEIVNQKRKGRESESEKIYFNSVGMGIQDVALAKFVFEEATKQDIGTKLNLWESAIFV